MTETPTPYSQPGTPHPGTPQPFTPAPKRPPLTPKQKRGAMLAGGLGFSIMTVGFGAVAISLGALLIMAVIGGISGLVERTGESSGGVALWVDQARTDFGWIVLVVALLGVIVWVVGYFTSVGILRSSGNPHPVATTWAALGISVAASWILSGILSIPGSFMSYLPVDNEWLQMSIIAGIASVALTIVVTAAIGVFTWWWMAHAMRRAAE
jgi:hypothetical protein